MDNSYLNTYCLDILSEDALHLTTDKFKSLNNRVKEVGLAIKNNLMINSTEICGECQKVLDTYIKGIKFFPYEEHGLIFSIRTFPGINDKKLIQSYILNPFKGSRYYKKKMLLNVPKIEGIKFKKNENGIVYFENKYDLDISFYISTITLHALNEKELVACALYCLGFWIEWEEYKKILTLRTFDLLANFPIPVIEILNLPINLVMSHKFRKIQRKSDDFVKNCGYGVHLASFLKKSGIDYIDNISRLNSLLGPLQSYFIRLDRRINFITKWFSNEENSLHRIQKLTDIPRYKEVMEKLRALNKDQKLLPYIEKIKNASNIEGTPYSLQLKTQETIV